MGSGDKTMGTFCVFPSSRLTDASEGRGGEGRSVNNSRGIFLFTGYQGGLCKRRDSINPGCFVS